MMMDGKDSPIGGDVLASSAAGIRAGKIKTAGLSPPSGAAAWAGFLNEWMLHGEVELRAPSSDWSSSAHVVRRDGGGSAIAFADAAPQRLVHSERHLRAAAPRALALYVVIGGGADIRQANGQLTVNAGDVVLRDAGGPSTISSESGFRWITTLVPTGSLGPAVLQRFDRSPYLFPADAPGRDALVGLVRSAAADLHRLPAAGFRQFEEAVASVLRYAGVAAATTPPPQAESANASVAAREALTTELLTIIDGNLRNPMFTLAGLAREVGLSERWVRQLLTAHGIRFKQHLIRRRLELARAALLDPACRNWSILSVALDHGFSDETHFSRCFAHAYGVSPGRFRRMARQSDRRDM